MVKQDKLTERITKFNASSNMSNPIESVANDDHDEIISVASNDVRKRSSYDLEEKIEK